MCFGALQTINDVVMGVSLAGLSRYLNRRYGKLPLILSSISLPIEPLYTSLQVAANYVYNFVPIGNFGRKLYK